MPFLLSLMLLLFGNFTPTPPTPPAPPSNVNAASATDLGALPAVVTEGLSYLGTDYTVWFKFTPAVSGTVSVWGYGVIGGNQAVVTIRTGPPSATVGYLGLTHTNVANIPLQFPVVAGTTYYIKVEPVTFAAPFTLTLLVDAAPSLTVPDDAIFINDDTSPFESILMGLDGAVKKFVPTVAGNAGDVLSTGAILLEDQYTNEGSFVLYNRSFVEQAIVSPLTVGLGRVRSTPMRDAFYIVSTGTDGVNPSPGATVAKVARVTTDGIVGTAMSLPGLGVKALAPNVDETILYLSGHNGAAPNIIQRFDLVNGVMLTDLTTISANPLDTITDMLVTQAGDLIVAYETFTPNRIFVGRYSAAGALLATYGFGTTPGGPSPLDTRLAYAWNDATTFWLWEHSDDDDQSHFRKIRISDAAVLVHIAIDQYDQGYYVGDETATPDRFGPSTSCPFLILGAVVTDTHVCADSAPSVSCWNGFTGTELQIRRVAQ